MINQNKLQNNINSAFFDQISQIQVKNVDLDFEVTKLFSEYQIPAKKTKLKTLDSIKNKNQSKKTSESSISTKQRSKNSEDSNNFQKNHQDTFKQDNQSSLKKNNSKKVLFVDRQQKEKIVETTVKKTQKKKQVFSEFEGSNQTERKLAKSPETIQICRKMSRLKSIPSQKCCPQNQIKKSESEVKEQQQGVKIRQSIDSNKNKGSFKKSRSKSITQHSSKRYSSKIIDVPSKIGKQKEQNMKIIMRDYFGQDEKEPSYQQKATANVNNLQVLKRKRSTSKSNKDIIVSRQRVNSKSKQIKTLKSRQRVLSKSKEKGMTCTTKGRFA